MKEFKNILRLLDSTEKIKLWFIIIMMFLVSIFEVISIGSIIPFTYSLIDNFNNDIVVKISEFFGAYSDQDKTQLFALLFILLFTVSLIFKSIVMYFSWKFILMREYFISKKLLKSYLQKNYTFFLNQNSSNISRNILSEVHEVVHNSLLPAVQFISHLILSLLIIIFLLFYETQISFIAIFVISICFIIFYFIFKKKIHDFSELRLSSNLERFKIIKDCFQLIREVKFLKIEDFFIKKFKKPGINYSNSQAVTLILATIPRYLIEIILILLISFFLIYNYIFNNLNINDILPTLALFGFAAYKLLPSLHQLYFNLSRIKYTSESLNELENTIKSLNKKTFKNKQQTLTCDNFLKVNSLTFKYKGTEKLILDKVNFKINKGEIIGIKGSSGSGKTTLLNIILGLIKPTHGNIYFDGHKLENFENNNLRKIIGYIPQDFYLLDATIRENITIGIEDKLINEKKLKKALIRSRLQEIIDDRGKRFKIGENGKRLSGGQKQRLSLARSIYFNPNLIIFDEATNSLDKKTESQILNDIISFNEKPAIIIVSHQEEVLKHCQTIYKLSKGKLYKE